MKRVIITHAGSSNIKRGDGKASRGKKTNVVGFTEQDPTEQLKGHYKVETTTQWQYITAPNERTMAASSLPIKPDERGEEKEDASALETKEEVTKELISSDKTTTWHYLVSPEGITLAPESIELNSILITDCGNISMKTSALTRKPTVAYHKNHLELSGYSANYEPSLIYSRDFSSTKSKDALNYDNVAEAVRADLPTALQNGIHIFVYVIFSGHLNFIRISYFKVIRALLFFIKRVIILWLVLITNRTNYEKTPLLRNSIYNQTTTAATSTLSSLPPMAVPMPLHPWFMIPRWDQKSEEHIEGSMRFQESTS
uniref:Uncharacterized protein n=1 Tax=Heterorhabditis bacteriophora TaxID=37862 RepID=A0A1I7WV42_HETBA